MRDHHKIAVAHFHFTADVMQTYISCNTGHDQSAAEQEINNPIKSYNYNIKAYILHVQGKIQHLSQASRTLSKTI